MRQLRDRARRSRARRCWTGRSGGSRTPSPGPSIEHPHRMVDEREDQVDALLDRGRRTLGHLLDRADSELTHTHARVVAPLPRRDPASGGTRCCSGRTGTWSARPDEVAADEVLRARVAEGEFAVRVVGTGRRRRSEQGCRGAHRVGGMTARSTTGRKAEAERRSATSRRGTS